MGLDELPLALVMEELLGWEKPRRTDDGDDPADAAPERDRQQTP